MLFSKPTEKNHVILLIDVQSSLVRGSLVYFRENVTPTVIYSETTNIAYSTHSGTSRLIKQTLKAIEDTLHTAGEFLHTTKPAHLEHPKKIHSVHFILSSPWVVSRAKKIQSKFATETTVNRKTISDIVRRERSKDIPKDVTDVDIIEEKIFEVRLNGYAVADWDGKTTRDLSVSFCTTIAGTAILARLREMSRHSVDKREVYFHSSLMLQYIGIDSVKTWHDDFILTHIHGELTDTVIVNHGTAVYFGSISRGINTVVRTLARSLDTTPAAAESLISLYSEGSMDDKEKSLDKIDKAASQWVTELTDAIKESYGMAMPKKTILSARSHDAFFKHAYKILYPQANIIDLNETPLKNAVVFHNTQPIMPLLALYVVALKTLMV